jgi:hypothetical protein
VSTKNLARTVIEGGRASYNKYERRDSNTSFRAANRAYQSALRDPEIAWSRTAPARTQVGRSFADKLGPIRRWLDRACGRPWDEVRSDIFRNFDVRTLAGRHIVFDHLLAEVAIHPTPRRYVHDRYYVDARGVLRRSPRRRSRRPRTWLTRAETRALRTFAGDRKIRHLGSAYFWLEMTFAYRWTKNRGIELHPTNRYRQTRRLTRTELARFTAMSTVAQATLIHPETRHAH